MSKYNCEVCVFKTGNKTDYNRHIKTKRHLEKVKQPISNSKSIPIQFTSDSSKFICEYCKNKYASQSNLTRHGHKCSKKIINKITNDSEMELLKKELKKIKKESKEKEKLLISQLETYMNLLQTFTQRV